MKRLVSCFLILCLMLSCTPGAVAAESASYAEYYTDSYESYLSSMNGWLWLDYLKNDNQFGFVQFSNKMEESTLLQKAISITIELMDGIHWNDVESPGNAEIAFYEDAILGLLVTMESELSSELDKQSEADATMTLMDYAVDGGQAAVNVAGALVGGKAAADIFMPLLNGLTGSESLIQGAMKNLESDAQYKALARSAHLYCDFEKVLSAILIKSDNEALKTAAQNVLDGINQSFTYKLENISSYTGDTAIPQLGSFVFDDVLGKSIESGDITGESAAMVNLFRGVNAFNAGAGIGAFIGNSVVGGHDIFLRYFEMLAMAEIRDCLIEDISQRVSSVTGPEDYNEIREIQSYLYALLYTCQRGEYCMYSLLAKDYTGIARFIFGGKTKNVDEWYASTSNVLKTAYDRIGEFTPDVSEIICKNFDFESIYLEFLGNNEYQSFVSEWIHGKPSQYAILDINGDSIKELLITGGDGTGFYNFAVFSYDIALKEIYVLEIVGTEIYGERNVTQYQYYGSLQYSPKYKALVFTELNNPSLYFDSYGYWIVEGRKLIMDFSISFERENETQPFKYSVFDSGHQKKKSISEKEFHLYTDESDILQWNSIPKQSLPSSSKEDLAIYMGSDFFSFVKGINGMHDVGATSGIEYTNGSIIVSTYTDVIEFISIQGDCDYSILGIEYGMPLETAEEIAYQSCQYITEDLPNQKRFSVDARTSIAIYAEDGKTVDSISLFSE